MSTVEIMELDILNRQPENYSITSATRDDWHIKRLLDENDDLVLEVEHMGEFDAVMKLRSRLGYQCSPILTTAQINAAANPPDVTTVVDNSAGALKTFNPKAAAWQ